jgi:hypothetical protein
MTNSNLLFNNDTSPSPLHSKNISFNFIENERLANNGEIRMPGFAN